MTASAQIMDQETRAPQAGLLACEVCSGLGEVYYPTPWHARGCDIDGPYDCPSCSGSGVGAFAAIPLSRGMVTVVDAADFEWLSQWKWHVRESGGMYYAVRERSAAERRAGGAIFSRMHRDIAGAPDGLPVDHRDGDGLNNRRSNLRICTHRENCANKSLRRDAVYSSFKGVTWNGFRWLAYIGSGRTKVRLGTFKNEVDAARSYDAAAIIRYGQFARLNFPDFAPANEKAVRK